jgi:hypothetical protein
MHACVCAFACVHSYVRASMRVCVRGCVCVRARCVRRAAASRMHP